jgi:hypothetical protein
MGRRMLCHAVARAVNRPAADPCAWVDVIRLDRLVRIGGRDSVKERDDEARKLLGGRGCLVLTDGDGREKAGQ